MVKPMKKKHIKKRGGSWIPYKNVYKKIDNNWVKQTDLSNLIQTDKPYIWG